MMLKSNRSSHYPVVREHVVLDPLRVWHLQPFFARSLKFQSDIKAHTMHRSRLGSCVLAAASSGALKLMFDRDPIIALMFCEGAIAPPVLQDLRRVAAIVAGSTWNEHLLRAYGFKHVRTILQGVDAALFHPGPKMGIMRDRFLIFSGGKVSLRKSQDIVLAAFKIFAARHPEQYW